MSTLPSWAHRGQVVVAFGLGIAWSCTASAQSCASPAAWGSVVGTFDASVCGALDEVSSVDLSLAPTACTNGPNMREVVADWTAPSDGTWTFQARADLWGPTWVGLRSLGSGCGDELACGDDGFGQAATQWDLAAGETVRVVAAMASSSCFGSVHVDVEPCGGDADGDGVCDAIDRCVGDDATGDGDADGVCTDLDAVCDPVVADLGSAVGVGVFSGDSCTSSNRWPRRGCSFGMDGQDLSVRWTAPSTGAWTFRHTFTSDAGEFISGNDYQGTGLWIASGDCGLTELACPVSDTFYSGPWTGSVQTVIDLDAGSSVVVVLDSLYDSHVSCGQMVLDVEACALGDADADGICDDTDLCVGDNGNGDRNHNGWCDPDAYVANPQGLPSQFTPGTTATLVLYDAKPGARAWWVVSPAPRGARVCSSTYGTCIRPGRPHAVLGPATVGPDGRASLEVTVPTAVAAYGTIYVTALWVDAAAGLADAAPRFGATVVP